MFDWIMRLEPEGWKILSWREGYIPSPQLPNLGPDKSVVDGASILTSVEREEGWRALFDGKKPATDG